MQILSFLTKAHFPGAELFLQISGSECLQPRVWCSLSCSESGRFWSGFIFFNDSNKTKDLLTQSSL